MSLALPTNVQAMQPCAEKYTLEYNLEKADVVFEGRFLRGDIYSGKLSKPMFYEDKSEENFITITFTVDKKWSKNVPDKEATIILFPLIEEKEVKKNKDYVRSDEYKKMWGNESLVVFLRSKDLDTGMYISPYYSCETGFLTMNEQNKAVLKKKFPTAAAQ